METEFLQFIGTLGVGGALAAMMFSVYRKDMKFYAEQWKGQSEALMVVVKENTKAVTTCSVLVEALRSELVDSRGRRGELDRRQPVPDKPASDPVL